jgi:hypothetical protein
MSVERKTGLTGGSSRGNQYPREFGAPAVRVAVQSGKRPFSRLFNLAASGLRKFVYRRPDAPASEHPALPESSLQGGNAALHRSKSLRVLKFSTGVDSGCVLCAAEHEDPVRLCRLAGLLPIGRTIFLPVLSRILDERFKMVSADLNFLIHELRLPIKGKPARGVTLTEPLDLCKDCAQIGEQLRQSETFQKHFKAVLLEPGPSSFGAQSEIGQGGLPVTSPNSC